MSVEVEIEVGGFFPGAVEIFFRKRSSGREQVLRKLQAQKKGPPKLLSVATFCRWPTL
jgi:hypothetical protein